MSYHDVINFATNRNILSGTCACISILIDLMLSENDKFKVCIRIPFANIIVQCCGLCSPTLPPISCQLLHTCMIFYMIFYYMAKPVLGKSLCSDWFLLGQDFAVRNVSVQPVYFCFGEKPQKLRICNQNSERKTVNIVILHSETTRKS